MGAEAASSKTGPRGIRHRKMNIAATAQGLILTLLRANLVLPLQRESQSVLFRDRLHFTGRNGEQSLSEQMGFYQKCFLTEAWGTEPPTVLLWSVYL